MNEACYNGDHFFRDGRTACSACGHRIYPKCALCSRFVSIDKAVCDDCERSEQLASIAGDRS